MERINMKNDFYRGYYEDHYISHHGIPGQKWGHKNGPPYPLKPEDHSAAEKKAKRRKEEESDEHISKGHKFERVYTEGKEPTSWQKKRLYVSDDASDYLNDYFFDELSAVKIQTIEAKKDMIIAGEKTINRILKDIGEKPLHKVFDKKGNHNRNHYGTDRDFLLKNEKLGKEFINRMLKEGYSGVKDPADAYYFSPSARILFDKRKYKISNDIYAHA